MDKRDDYQLTKSRLHRKILDRLDLEKLRKTSDNSARDEVLVLIRSVVNAEVVPLSFAERERLAREILAEIFGLGPLEQLLKDPGISRRQLRLVIADNNPIFRDGLRRLLEAEADLKVLGEASDGVEAVKLVRQLNPDILLLDLAMPKHPGLEVLRDLSSPGKEAPVRVILLTAAADKGQIVEALQLGARGVVLKDSASRLLLKAIQTVMAGEYWLGRESVSTLVQYLRSLMHSRYDEAPQRNLGLTPREIEIVSAVVAGYSNKEIAEYFKISVDSVKRYLSNIFVKLGGPEDGDAAGIEVKKPIRPNLNSGSAAASLDEL